MASFYLIPLPSLLPSLPPFLPPSLTHSLPLLPQVAMTSWWSYCWPTAVAWSTETRRAALLWSWQPVQATPSLSPSCSTTTATSKRSLIAPKTPPSRWPALEGGKRWAQQTCSCCQQPVLHPTPLHPSPPPLLPPPSSTDRAGR